MNQYPLLSKGILWDSFNLCNCACSAYLALKWNIQLPISPWQLQSSAELQSNLNSPLSQGAPSHPDVAKDTQHRCENVLFILPGHDNHQAFWKLHLEDTEL